MSYEHNRIAILEAEWRRECADADKIVEKLGLTVEQARTEGGSLKVAFICNHIQETLDALADTDARRIALFNKNAELESTLAKSASREAALVEAIDCCYRMLISEADTRHALFKAENILRDAIAKIKIKDAS